MSTYVLVFNAAMPQLSSSEMIRDGNTPHGQLARGCNAPATSENIFFYTIEYILLYH